MSDRAIAAGTGASSNTVRAARQKSGAQSCAPETTIDNPPKGDLWDDQNDREDADDIVEKRVIGKDGKSYPATPDQYPSVL